MLIESFLLVIGVLLIAFLIAPLGLGGGILYVPLFHYIGGWELDQRLIIISLLLSAVTSYGSGLEHRKQHYVDDELTGIALWGAIPGAMIGVLFVLSTGTQFKAIFKLLSIVVVGFVIYKMVNRLLRTDTPTEDKGQVELGKLSATSAFGGFLSSVMAIGAGMIYVPAMKFFGKLETRKAIGSSLNIMMIVVPFAVLAHFILLTKYQKEKLFDESIVLVALIIANFSGSKIGAIVGFRLFDENLLVKIFIGVLSITWINYLADLLLEPQSDSMTIAIP